MVATTSDSHSAPDERVWVESSKAGSSNMTLARIAPAQPPTIWAATWTIASGVSIVPWARAVIVTAGLK